MLNSITAVLVRCILLTAIVLPFVSACGSKHEDAEKYTKSGYLLLGQGESIKAGLQFRNALQINNKLVSAWYGLSQVEEKQGNLDAVYTLLNKVIELEPSHIDAHLKLGKIMLAGKLIDKALKQSEKILTLAPDNADVRAFRAAVLLQLADFSGAIEEANIALSKDPANVDAFIVLANERISNDDVDGAVKYLDKGIAYNQKNPLLHLVKIKVLNDVNDFRGIISVFNRLIALYPDNKIYKIALARYYVTNNRFEQADAVYKGVIAKHQNDVELKLESIRFVLKERGPAQAIIQLNSYVLEQPTQYKLQFALAELFLLNKQRDKAVGVYNSVIKSDADSSIALSAQNKLATLVLSEGEIAKAKQLVDEVIKKEPSNSEAMTISANIELQQGHADKAIVILRTVLKNYPDSVRALVLLARAHIQDDSKDLAKDIYASVIRNAPANPDVVLEYVDFLVRNKELNSADNILQSLLERTPDSLPALQASAKLKLRMGDWMAAHELAERIKNSGGKDVVIEQILGAAYEGQKKHEQSIEAFRRAYSASPKYVQPIVSLVRAYVKAGKHNEAVSFLESVLDIHPSNPYALILLGQWYIQNKDDKQGELYLKRAVNLNPKSVLGYRELAYYYMNRAKYPDALAMVNRGLMKLPNNFSLQLTKARINELNGRIDLAISLYEQILGNNPNVGIAANNLASLLSEHYDDGKTLHRALDLAQGFENSPNPYYRDTLGWVYYKLGQPQKATALFKRVIEDIPGIAVFHYHLGMSLLAEGKKDMAKVELEKAVSLSVEDKTVLNNALKALRGM